MNPDHIIIHCSDSLRGTLADIDSWHRARGWEGVGYHWVIRNASPGPDGLLEGGRHESRTGAHCLGYNARSIGVCLIGRGAYSPAQIQTLKALVRRIQRRYGIPTANVLGHCETDSGRRQGKTCPMLGMNELRRAL